MNKLKHNNKEVTEWFSIVRTSHRNLLDGKDDHNNVRVGHIRMVFQTTNQHLGIVL